MQLNSFIGPVWSYQRRLILYRTFLEKDPREAHGRFCLITDALAFAEALRFVDSKKI